MTLFEGLLLHQGRYLHRNILIDMRLLFQGRLIKILMRLMIKDQ